MKTSPDWVGKECICQIIGHMSGARVMTCSSQYTSITIAAMNNTI